MLHELTVYRDGSVDGADFHIRQGEMTSHICRFRFMEGISGSNIRLRLKNPGGDIEVYDIQKGAGTMSDNAAEFTPHRWAFAGTVQMQLEAMNGAEMIWRSQIFSVRVFPALEALEIAPYVDTSMATATAEDVRIGKIACGNGALIYGALEPGILTNDATATAEDVRIGKTAYVNGKLIWGTYTPPLPMLPTSMDVTLDLNTYMSGYNFGEYPHPDTLDIDEMYDRIDKLSDTWMQYTDTNPIMTDEIRTLWDVLDNFRKWSVQQGLYTESDFDMNPGETGTVTMLGGLKQYHAGAHARWIYIIDENISVIAHDYEANMIRQPPSNEVLLEKNKQVIWVYLWDWTMIPVN